MIQKDETQQTNTSYILAFLNDIELLFDYAAGYINLIIYLNHQYSNLDDKQLEQSIKPADYNALKDYANITRSLIFKTYTRLYSLEINDIDENLKDKLKESYEKSLEKLFIDKEVIIDYVQTINKIFVQSIALSKWKNTKNELKSLT